MPMDIDYTLLQTCFVVACAVSWIISHVKLGLREFVIPEDGARWEAIAYRSLTPLLGALLLCAWYDSWTIPYATVGSIAGTFSEVAYRVLVKHVEPTMERGLDKLRRKDE